MSHSSLKPQCDLIQTIQPKILRTIFLLNLLCLYFNRSETQALFKFPLPSFVGKRASWLLSAVPFVSLAHLVIVRWRHAVLDTTIVVLFLHKLPFYKQSIIFIENKQTYFQGLSHCCYSSPKLLNPLMPYISSYLIHTFWRPITSSWG